MMLAFVNWPFLSIKSHTPAHARFGALVLGATSVSLRPPAAALWAFLGFSHLAQTHDPLRFLVHATGAVVFVFGIVALIDAHYYGSWTFPPLNFIVWNAISGGASRYGTHPWCVNLTLLPHLVCVTNDIFMQ